MQVSAYFLFLPVFLCYLYLMNVLISAIDRVCFDFCFVEVLLLYSNQTMPIQYGIQKECQRGHHVYN